MENLENIDKDSSSKALSYQNSKSLSFSEKNIDNFSYNSKNSNLTKCRLENTRNIEILPETTQKINLSFKIILIGDSYSGKSSLLRTAIKNKFGEDYNSTIGFDCLSFFVKINEIIIKLQIWDTCGQEIYKSLITNFYRESSLAIMIYSIDNKESFQNISNWLKEIKKNSNPNAKIFLIGNKNDLEKEREVTYEEGKQYAINHKFCKFFETSAKTGDNTQKIFIEAANVLYDEYLDISDSISNNISHLSNLKDINVINSNNNESINATKGKNKKKKFCC